jgi:hypothetical protein
MALTLFIIDGINMFCDKSVCASCDKKRECEMLRSLISKSGLSGDKLDEVVAGVLGDAKYLETKKAEINRFATSVVEGMYRIVDSDSRATYVMKELIDKFLAYVAYKDPENVERALLGLTMALLPLLPTSMKTMIASAITVTTNAKSTETTPDGVIIN